MFPNLLPAERLGTDDEARLVIKTPNILLKKSYHSEINYNQRERCYIIPDAIIYAHNLGSIH